MRLMLACLQVRKKVVLPSQLISVMQLLVFFHFHFNRPVFNKMLVKNQQPFQVIICSGFLDNLFDVIHATFKVGGTEQISVRPFLLDEFSITILKQFLDNLSA